VSSRPIDAIDWNTCIDISAKSLSQPHTNSLEMGPLFRFGYDVHVAMVVLHIIILSRIPSVV
jgi:hypothetical protein